MSATGIDSTTVVVVSQSKTLTPNAIFSDGSTQNPKPADLPWASSDPFIATVDSNGSVKAIASGDATLSFTYQKVTGTVEVSVAGRPPDEGAHTASPSRYAFASRT